MNPQTTLDLFHQPTIEGVEQPKLPPLGKLLNYSTRQYRCSGFPCGYEPDDPAAERYEASITIPVGSGVKISYTDIYRFYSIIELINDWLKNSLNKVQYSEAWNWILENMSELNYVKIWTELEHTCQELQKLEEKVRLLKLAKGVGILQAKARKRFTHDEFARAVLELGGSEEDVQQLVYMGYK
jgi:hypothetical protein